MQFCDIKDCDLIAAVMLKECNFSDPPYIRTLIYSPKLCVIDYHKYKEDTPLVLRQGHLLRRSKQE